MRFEEVRFGVMVLSAVMLAWLPAGGGGGGGGGSGGVGLETKTITSTPSLDGRIFVDGGGELPSAALPISIGHGGIGPTASRLVGLVSFLMAQPAGVDPSKIVSAELTMECFELLGDQVDTNLGMDVSHVNYGNAFSTTVSGFPVLQASFASIALLQTVGPKTVSVLDQVKADLTAGRTRAQFQLDSLGAHPTNQEISASFNDGENAFATGNLPTLVIRHAP